MKNDNSQQGEEVFTETGRNRTARWAGFSYLLFILTMAFANLVGRAPIIVEGDPSATAANILSHGLAFRIGFVADLCSALLFILTAWNLYRLLKPVGRNLATLFLILNLCGAAIQCLSLSFLYAALPLLGEPYLLSAIPPEQLKAQALFFLGLYKASFMSAQLFFGAWTLPLGWLIFKSGFLPKALGILLMADCVAILFWFFQFFFFPTIPSISYPSLALSFIAEASLTFWLLIKGAGYRKHKGLIRTEIQS